MMNVLTGFKFIAEQIQHDEETGEHTFMFGFEESYGYLVKSFVRDKDAVQAVLLLTEVAAHFKNEGKTLYDGLQALYAKHGYFLEKTISVTVAGLEGPQKIKALLDGLRASVPTSFGGLKVALAQDFAVNEQKDANGVVSEIGLPTSNVLKYIVQMKKLDVTTVLHTGRVSKQLPLLIAVPTTAGTGSEVTAGAVITDPIKKRKYALSHLFLIPKYAVLDSSLLVSLPSNMTAYTGMDALTHAIEAYINCFNNRKTNEYALCAIKSIFQYLVPSFEDGLNKHYRLELLDASYNAGVAISNNYVGYVHAIAHGIGGMYHLQHGMINAIILPIVLEEYGSAVVSKLAKIADVVGITGTTDQDKSKQFIQKLKDLNQIFSIPTSIPEIQEEDIHYFAIGAEKEGNPSYPTPVTWDVEQFEKVIRKIKHGYTI